MPALDVLLAPENLLVNVVCGLSVQFAYLALLARVLPPRSTRTFWTVEILYQGATMFLKALYPVPLRIAVGVFGSLVIPLFMLRGSLLRRLVVCSLCLSAQTGAELVAADGASGDGQRSGASLCPAVHCLRVGGDSGARAYAQRPSLAVPALLPAG